MFVSAGLSKEFITSEAEVLLEHGFTNFDKLGVEVLGLDRSQFFSKFYENSTPHIHNRTSVSSTVLEDNFLSLKAFKNTVSALIINGKWPILLEDLQALYPQFTPEKICQITNTELNLTIDGAHKGTPKLSNEQ